MIDGDRTREEHLAWCKQRALEYLPDDPANALVSMRSDLGKHSQTSETARLCDELGMGELLIALPRGTAVAAKAMRRFIEGIN